MGWERRKNQCVWNQSLIISRQSLIISNHWSIVNDRSFIPRYSLLSHSLMSLSQEFLYLLVDILSRVAEFLVEHLVRS